VGLKVAQQGESAVEDADIAVRGTDGQIKLYKSVGCDKCGDTGYDGRAGTAYLIRPDRYVAARWRRPDARELAAALRRATGHG